MHVAVDTRSAPRPLLATRPLLWLAVCLSPLARLPLAFPSRVPSRGQVDEEVAQGVTNFVSLLIEGEVPCGRRTRDLSLQRAVNTAATVADTCC